jgi:hypothetical protein
LTGAADAPDKHPTTMRRDMAALEKISVQIRTGNREGGGTDGDIYIGICGREFFLDSRRSSTDDFE